MDSKFRNLCDVLVLVALLACACAEPEFPECRPAAAQCEVGGEGCRCTAGGACDPGLTCKRGLCQEAELPCQASSTGDPGTGANDEDNGAAEPELPDCRPPVYWGR